MSRRITTLATQSQQQQQQRSKSTADAAGTGRRSVADGARLGLIKEGDVFYRTVLRYPALPDVDDQVSLVVTNAAAETPFKKSSTDRQARVDRPTDRNK